MRLRLLAFFPPAAFVTAVLLVSVSSLVSALETSLTPDVMIAVKVQRYESDCDVLKRKINELSRNATSCDADLQCLSSPILCPIEMDAAQEREYRNLRAEFAMRCGLFIASEACGSTFDRPASDANDRATEPATFVF
jgi:hypothetical protein